MISRFDGSDKVADVTLTKNNTPEPETPIKRTISWTGPFGSNFQVARYGDVVTMSCNNTTNNTIPTTGTSNEILPYGYRPYTAVSTVARYGVNHGFATMSTAGKLSWGFAEVDPTAQRLTISFSYITNDGEPN